MTIDIPAFTQKQTMDQVVTRAVLIRQSVRTPTGRIGRVTGEHDGRINIEFDDLEGGEVSLRPQLVEFLPP